jgi:hypothetical protein
LTKVLSLVGYVSSRVVEILFNNWLCLTEFDGCGSLDTVVSMEMRRPTHLQEQGGGSGSGGYLNHTAPAGVWRLLVVNQECG